MSDITRNSDLLDAGIDEFEVSKATKKAPEEPKKKKKKEEEVIE